MNRKLLILLILVFSFPALSAVQMKLTLPSTQVKQGSLKEGTLIVDAENLPQFELQKLKGTNFAQSLYFHEIGALLKKDGDQAFAAPVRIIFTAVPDRNFLTGNVNGEEINLYLENITVESTEAAPELIFGTFQIPPRSRLVFWVLLCLVIMILAGAGFWLYTRLSRKRRIRAHKAKLKSELESANTFDDVVELWKKKKTYINEFPHVEAPYRRLEETLFLYQFKPRQSEEEKAKILKAYQEFKNDINGGFRGI